MKNIKAGLVGVTGYTGMEMARLLATHPGMRLVCATSRSRAGQTLGDLFPGLRGFACAEVVVTVPDAEELARSCDVVFLAVPHGAAMDFAAELLEAGVPVVDLSADFRLNDSEVYAQWYGLDHRHPGLLPEAVYGLPEINAEAVAKARLVANPGCYPTSVILGLYPALKSGLIHTDDIVADSKSGTTGAGRKASVGSLFCEVHDSFKAYNLGRHRHTPEIEQEISRAAGTDVKVSFNTHLLPISRGILSTTYTRLKSEHGLEDIHDLYTRFYADAPWVRVLPLGELPETRWVRGTMFCDMGLVVDPRTGRLIVVTAIDNLCRGASGQALANANLICGLPLQAGLDAPAIAP